MPRPRVYGKRTVADPKGHATAYKQEIHYATLLNRRSKDPTDLPCELDVQFGVSNPTAVGTGDIDNLSKTVMDALNGLVWLDDRQVVRLIARKTFAKNGKEYTRIVVQDITP